MTPRAATTAPTPSSITFDIGTDQDLAAVDVQNRISVAAAPAAAGGAAPGPVIAKRQPQCCARGADLDRPALRLPVPQQLLDAECVRRAVARARRRPGDDLRRARLRHAHLARPGQDGAARRHRPGHLGRANEQNVVARRRPHRGGAGAQGYGEAVHGACARPARHACAVRAHHPALAPDGASVRLGGRRPARARRATDYSRSSLLDGEPVAIIGIYQQPDANALDVAKRVRATMASCRRPFPRASSTRSRSTPRRSCRRRSRGDAHPVRGRRCSCSWSCSCSCRAGARR